MIWRFRLLFFIVFVFVHVADPAYSEEVQTTRQEPQATWGNVSPISAENYTPVSLWPESIDGVLGGKEGYFHPFLSVGEFFTDNYFHDENNEKNEFYTVIRPGIWLALPASRQPMLQMATVNTAPGGLEVSRFRTDTDRRLQGYALYRADIERHGRFSDDDNVYHRAEGLLNYNFPGGLSLELVDFYVLGHDPYGTGDSRKLDKFDSNLVQALAVYQLAPKTRLRAEYSFYYLNFSSDRNAFRKREDNLVSIYAFYRLGGKTEVFLEYDFIDINYDENILSDSNEHHYFAGAEWRITEKSRGRIKAGMGAKDFTDSQGNDRTDFIGEAQLEHKFTPKTSVSLKMVRRTNETDISGTQSVLTHRLQVGYLQRLSPKLSGTANLYYRLDSYDGDIIVDTKAGEREDDYYGAGAAIGYAFQRWLNLNLAYAYVQRDSNFDTYDYQANSVFLSVTGAL